MSPRYQTAHNQPREITSLDARIANAGGTSSRLELQPHRLSETKIRPAKSAAAQLEDLVRENGHLRQEIAFYQESRNAMLAFHDQVLGVYKGLQGALRDLSEKMACAESRIERYWGVTEEDKDITVI